MADAKDAPHNVGAADVPGVAPVTTGTAKGTAKPVGWVTGLSQKVGNTMADHPVKSTLAITMAAGVLKERVVDPLLDKAIDLGKSVFAAGAKAEVEKEIAGDAVAHATGTAASGLLAIVGKAFSGVVK